MDKISLQGEINALKMENMNQKFRIKTLLEARQVALGNNEQIINYKEKILQLQITINELTNKCDDLIFMNEVLNDELLFERQKFQIFTSFNKRDFNTPNFQEQNNNLKKKLEIDFKNNNQNTQELEKIICNQYEKIILLDLDKQKLLTKLKLQTNSGIVIQEEDSQQNVSELQQNLEKSRQQIKKIELQFHEKQQQFNELNQKYQQLLNQYQQQQKIHQSKQAKPTLLDTLQKSIIQTQQSYDIHQSYFSKSIIQTK
ncbi:unnamed protein product (macronuclear) [Paramecium tetraurelia]|uniref:Uncharacterized protein n=1 Tax=Paramecium tetraurelia TaxID=5888 RepID=A0EDA9_PARTE|nr:uncharacterized protein GSPATT00004145001 [Paramecium tetraurelia]CAK93276.1 unnamed protein product [Paramecium tetraurelia]|eukprot:XP_001460673.1 hypothetical protein (macronuclear) [Paramecium tetraurelia strain d4-2]